MIDKILKDIKGLFKVQDKAKFLKQNTPYLAFFYIGSYMMRKDIANIEKCKIGSILL